MTYPTRRPIFITKLVTSKLFWALAVSFLFCYPLIKSIQRSMPAELPYYGAVPYFNFLDENGNSFGTNELKGKVYVANFMFTTCTTMCPVLLKKMQTVQHRMRGVIDRAAIVSFTVDPETDTPEVLFKKARELKANAGVWRFLSGSLADTKKLLVDGFKVPVGEKTTANSIMEVGHSNKLVLVDQSGKIRGYYASDTNGINHLMLDSGILINEKKKSI
ncbi:MAG TPA: SCO family protein [Bacteriovoracaceae bacterium]|nr:SCO family protein [Bacteriovoracaceae bacterium]